MPFINQTSVPQELYDMARSIKARGGKAFLSRPETDTGNCTNCGGCGDVVLQVIAGGPYATAGETTRKEGISAIYEKGRWYDVKTRTFGCPICRSDSVRNQARSENGRANTQPADPYRR